jgi:uroporphyrinogen decarboxylase
MNEIKPIRETWPSSMTDRERFNNQMHYRPVDRCFNMEFGYWRENFKEWDLFVDNGITDNWQADIFFGFDRSSGAGGHLWMHPPFESKVIRETETTVVVRNHDGLLAETPKDGHDTIPHYVGATVKTPDDWKQVKEERFNPDHECRTIDVEAVKKNHPPGRDYPLGIGCGSLIGRIRNMLTVEGLAYATADHPEMIEDMVETVCRLVEKSLDQLLGEVDFDFATGWEDISCKSGPLVSASVFRDIVVPRYKRIGDRLHAHGIDIWYTDCDGDVRPLLGGFMEAGINCLFPYEVNSCCHPGELLDEYGKDLRIMGGVDKIELGKGPAAIKKYLESLVPYVERGGYIPFCDHRCPPNVKPEDYLYYLDLKKELFCRPLTFGE